MTPQITYGQILGAVIRYDRKVAGLSQKEMAQAIDLSTSTWSRVENGHTDVSIVHLRRAAVVLDRHAYQWLQTADDLCPAIQEQLPAVHIGLPGSDTWSLGSSALFQLVSSILVAKGRTRD